MTVVTIYQGLAGDRNPRGILGAALAGRALGERLNVAPFTIGRAARPLGGRWDRELESALGDLRELADHLARMLSSGTRVVTTMGRCAAGLATLPVIARMRPDARIIWFDAHADANTPATSTTGYLGGMVLTGAAGMWPTGLGAGLDLGRVMLVGARELDPAERDLVRVGKLDLVSPGVGCVAQFREMLEGSPVYVHLDCDVLEPGIVPTEYCVPGGLSLPQLKSIFEMLAECAVVGLEIAEFESSNADPMSVAALERLLDAVQPVVGATNNPG